MLYYCSEKGFYDERYLLKSLSVSDVSSTEGDSVRIFNHLSIIGRLVHRVDSLIPDSYYSRVSLILTFQSTDVVKGD